MENEMENNFNSIKRVVAVMVITALVFTMGLPFTTSTVSAAERTYSKTLVTKALSTDASTPDWRTSGYGWSSTKSPRNPSAPLQSECVAKFASYDLEDEETGFILMKEKFNLEKAETVTYEFYMYHDTEDDMDDYISASLTDDKTIKTYTASKVYRYDGSTGWKKHTIVYPVNADFAKSPLSPGLRGYSDWGNNMYVYDLTITAQFKDSTEPSNPVLSADKTSWTNKDVKITLKHGEDADSGVERSEYRVGTSGTWTTYDKPITVKKNAKIYARSIDKVGFISKETSISVNNIDKVAPKITAKAKKKTIKNKAKVKNATVTVTIKDTNLKGKTVKKSGKKTKWPKKGKFTKKGKYVITATDKAGNKTTFTFTIK